MNDTLCAAPLKCDVNLLLSNAPTLIHRRSPSWKINFKSVKNLLAKFLLT